MAFLLVFAFVLAPPCLAQRVNLQPGLDQAIASALASGGTPGLAIAVVTGGEQTYLKHSGFADVESRRAVAPRTRFYIASTTKSLTALAAAQLAHRGVMKLDAPLDRYLPELKLQPPLSPAEITLRDLLTMTHGIQGGPVDFRTAFTGEFTPALLVDLLKLHAPSKSGRAFSYGNLGYVVYSLVLDRRFKEGWKRVVDSEVLAPLGMRDTTAFYSTAAAHTLAQPYEVGPGGLERVEYAKRDENMHAAGGHLSTAEDLARYIEAHLNGGRLGGKQVIPAQVIAETQRPQTEQKSRYGEYQRESWGLGWDIARYEGALLLSRFGGFAGFYSHVSFLPEARAGVVVLANGGAASGPLADMIANYVYDSVLKKPDAEQKLEQRLASYRTGLARRREAIGQERDRRKARSQQTLLPLAAYAGVYENAALGRLQLTYHPDGLTARMGAAGSRIEVYDGTKHQLRIELTGVGQVMAFETEGERPVAFRLGGELFRRLP